MAKTSGKMLSGFCSNGHHEGTRPRNWQNKPMKVCEHWLTCGCTCHDDITRLFELTGAERMPQPNPEYVPDKGHYVLPTVIDRVTATRPHAGTTSVTRPDTPRTLESPAPGLLPPRVTTSYGPTASGRLARGQLTDWVRTACDTWVVEEFKFPCTVAWIIEEIGTTQGIDPPSAGPVFKILEKWEALGFAKVGRKPTRFESYTEAGISEGLEVLERKLKERKKTFEKLGFDKVLARGREKSGGRR